MGDIGEHFPDTDERWRDADSIELLRGRGRAVDRARASSRSTSTAPCHGGAPSWRPTASAIRERLAGALGLERGRVNVKATTGEGIGFVGARRGRRGAGRRQPSQRPACAERARCARSCSTTPAAASCGRCGPREQGTGRDLRLRADRLQPHPHRQRPPVRRLQPAARFLAHEGYDVTPGDQHHRRQRQDLRRRRAAGTPERRARRAR